MLMAPTYLVADSVIVAGLAAGLRALQGMLSGAEVAEDDLEAFIDTLDWLGIAEELHVDRRRGFLHALRRRRTPRADARLLFPCSGTGPGRIEQERNRLMSGYTIKLTPYAHDLLHAVIDVEDHGYSESKMVEHLCIAYFDAVKAAGPRPAETWQSQIVAGTYLGPHVRRGAETPVDVVARVSYRQDGTATDFQAITVTATAHSPICDRLRSSTGEPQSETVAIEGFAAWLEAAGEAAAAEERAEYDDDVEVHTAIGQCCCLAGTPVHRPQSQPGQPDDLVFLVGSDARRYEDLFHEHRFGTYTCDDLDEVMDLKSLRWIGLSVEEVCNCAEPHQSWGECPIASADCTFECDRACETGCDWVLYPLHGHAWLSVHGTDVDLGPAGDDHTQELTTRYLPELRL